MMTSLTSRLGSWIDRQRHLERPALPPLAGNTDTTLLKLIALLFMFIDHAGKMCFPAVNEMRLLGRIAFPLYCWCLVVGASYTRSFPKYLLRIGLIGLVSQPIYMVALHHPWQQANIFLTLFVALLGLWGLREQRWGSRVWAPILALIAAELLSVDYGWRGVFLCFLLWACREKRSALGMGTAAFCLYWGSTSFAVTNIWGLSLNALTRSSLGGLFAPFFKLQAFALLALPLMLIPMRRRFKLPSWVGYAIYPAHLVLLILLEYAMGKTVHWEHLENAWNAFAGLF